MNGEIKHLFVTLKRSFAGTRESHVNILKSLGLRKREQTVQQANNASVRGAIGKVGTRGCSRVARCDAELTLPGCIGPAPRSCRD